MFDPEADDEQLPESADGGQIEKRLGIQVVPLNAQIASQLGASSGTRGLAVGAVDPNSDAARKGLQRGDIILSANYRDVVDIAGLEAVIGQATTENRNAVLLRVQRRGRPATYLPVRLR